MQNRSFAQYLHFRDFKILTSRKLSGCCGSEVAQALILNKSPGFAKPSINYYTITDQSIKEKPDLNTISLVIW
ncbi:MAG TPA: hypothetical protein VKA34_13780 [Balneolales bacterium]|nr:hypothetical protein [Balneolales bacterium]